MHRLWTVVELSDMIISYLPLDALRGIARCARLFNLPTARYIWRDVDLNALKYLVDVVLQPSFDGGLATATNERLHRFRLYAGYIHDCDLAFNFHRDSALSDRLLLAFCLSKLGLALPNLRKLRVFATEPEHLLVAKQFLVPSLIDIKVVASYYNRYGRPSVFWDERIEPMLDSIALNAPMVETLSLHLNFETLHLEAASRLIGSLRMLEHFTTGDMIVAPTLIAALARSPRLESMYFNCLSKPSEVHSEPSLLYRQIPCSRFEELKRLVADGDIEVIVPLLENFDADLEAIDLILDLGNCNTTLEEFLPTHVTALANAIASFSASLTFLDLGLEETIKVPNVSPTKWELFLPLLRCLRLTSFSFGFASVTTFDLQDCHVAQMAEAWPQMTSLELIWSPKEPQKGGGLYDEAALTLLSLKSLATSCPDLTHLRITSLDCSKIPCHTAVSGQEDVIALSIGHCLRPAWPGQIALFLVTLWPNMTLTRYMGDATSFWDSVAQLVVALQCQDAFETQPHMVEQLE